MALSFNKATVMAGNICASDLLGMGLLPSFSILHLGENLSINLSKE